MFFELGKIHFVISVGHCVVIYEVIRLLLIGDECWDALEHEIKVVGSPFHVRGEFGSVEWGQRRQQTLCSGQQIFSSTYGEARGLARARVEDDYARGLVEF